MSSSTLQKWVVCRQPRPEATLRLFCAAWAGGSASVFNKWPSLLPREVELRAIQLPGRMSRIGEECLTSISAIVENIAEVLITLGLLDKPFAFFGHSMGALVMYELAHRLARDTRVAPRFLVISGCRPPNMWVGGLSPPVSKLPRGELVNHLLGLGGLPAELKDERVLLDRFLPTIRADYAALEVFEPDLGRAPLDCPVVCFGGMDDRGASPDDLANWAKFTTGGFQLHMFPGGHFFLKDDGAPAVVAKLSEVLTAR